MPSRSVPFACQRWLGRLMSDCALQPPPRGLTPWQATLQVLLDHTHLGDGEQSRLYDRLAGELALPVPIESPSIEPEPPRLPVTLCQQCGQSVPDFDLPLHVELHRCGYLPVLSSVDVFEKVMGPKE